MIRRMLFSGPAMLAASAVVAFADAKADLQAAAQKLADVGNYTWNTTIEGGFGGATDGKTEKAGYTVWDMTMRDNSYTVVMKGDKAVAKTEDGWKAADELGKDDNGDGGPNPER